MNRNQIGRYAMLDKAVNYSWSVEQKKKSKGLAKIQAGNMSKRARFIIMLIVAQVLIASAAIAAPMMGISKTVGSIWIQKAAAGGEVPAIEMARINYLSDASVVVLAPVLILLGLYVAYSVFRVRATLVGRQG